MATVDVFISTSYKGPRRGDGFYSYLLRFITAAGKEVTKWETIKAEDCTQNRAELLAFLKALKSMKVKCTLNIYTDCAYIQSGIETWSEGWIARGWKNAKGEDIANAEEWKEILILLYGNEVFFHINEQHEFKTVMKREIERRINDEKE